MFGPVLPAYGLYVRHVKNLTIENIQCRVRKPDYRPAFIFDDVHNASLNNFQADVSLGKSPIIRIDNSSDILLSRFRATDNVPLFLKVNGADSQRIDIRDNDFDKIKRKVEYDKKVKKSEILGL
ncbi:uncharacterized protein BN472_02709 [Tannerella sp. CAG:118]|nr:uncharacterized protein BN472_02709 [Tannerella sp. CAG:118]